AEDEILLREAQARGQQLLQFVAAAVGIVVQHLQRLADGGERPRRGPDRVLVGGHLEDVLLAHVQLARRFRNRLARHVRCDRPDVLRGESLQVRRAFASHLGARTSHLLHSTAAGYDPSTLRYPAIFSTSASAAATLASSRWPSMSTKKRYSHSATRDGRDSNLVIDTPRVAKGVSISYT